MQDDDGGVWHKQTSEKFCDFIMPEKDKLVSFVIGTGKDPFKSSCATGDFAAVMAIAGRVYVPYNPAFAARCLRAARQAWAWIGKYPNVTFNNPPGVGTGGYGDRNCADERLWAAAELFRSTGDQEYQRYFLDHYAEFRKSARTDPPSWANVGALALWTYALGRGRPTLPGGECRRRRRHPPGFDRGGRRDCHAHRLQRLSHQHGQARLHLGLERSWQLRHAVLVADALTQSALPANSHREPALPAWPEHFLVVVRYPRGRQPVPPSAPSPQRRGRTSGTLARPALGRPQPGAKMPPCRNCPRICRPPKCTWTNRERTRPTKRPSTGMPRWYSCWRRACRHNSLPLPRSLRGADALVRAGPPWSGSLAGSVPMPEARPATASSPEGRPRTRGSAPLRLLLQENVEPLFLPDGGDVSVAGDDGGLLGQRQSFW